MPELKNQHFVPKVHLRAFSDDEGEEPKIINVINVEREKAIRNASLSGQCAKHYFYGKNLEVERNITKLEGMYAQSVREVKAGLTSPDLLASLRWWAYFQYLRTDSARRRFKEFHDQLNEAVADPKWQVNLSDEELVIEAMRTFFESQHLIEDLKPVILENATERNFITSDAPSVVFNKWMDQKYSRNDYGISSSGVCIYLPLTPRQALLCYDSNVYQIHGLVHSKLKIASTVEIDLLNSVIMRADAKNVYFRGWDQHADLLAQTVREKPYRTPAARVQFLVPVEGIEGRFRPLREGEDPTKFKKSLLHSQSIFPRPSQWFGFLRNKVRPVAFNNGSAAGFVRKRVWLMDGGLLRPQRQRLEPAAPKALPGLPGNPFRER